MTNIIIFFVGWLLKQKKWTLLFPKNPLITHCCTWLCQCIILRFFLGFNTAYYFSLPYFMPLLKLKFHSFLLFIFIMKEPICIMKELICIKKEHIYIMKEHIYIKKEHICIKKEHICIKKEHICIMKEHICIMKEEHL